MNILVASPNVIILEKMVYLWNTASCYTVFEKELDILKAHHVVYAANNICVNSPTDEKNTSKTTRKLSFLVKPLNGYNIKNRNVLQIGNYFYAFF